MFAISSKTFWTASTTSCTIYILSIKPFFPGSYNETKKCTDTDEVHCMSIVGQSRQRPVYLCCAIMCDLSIEWPVMSKHCTSSDYAFEDETDSAIHITASEH